MAISTAAAVIGGLGLAGSAYAGREARKGAEAAADAQTRAGQESIAAQEAAAQRAIELQDPFRSFGMGASRPLQNLLGIGLGDRGLIQSEISRLENFIQSAQGDDPRMKMRRDLAQSKLTGYQNQLASLPDLSLPDLPTALDLSTLPAAGQAFDPSAIEDNPIYDFLLDEGFRGIREKAAVGGRNPDRDLVQFAQGTAASLFPALQAKQFGQQNALRDQALGEQASVFAQQGGLRDQARAEQQQKIQNLLGALNLGQAAASGQAAAGTGAAANIGNILGNIGTAQAQSALAKSAANQNFASNLLGVGTFLGDQLLPQQQPQQQSQQQPQGFNFNTGIGMRPQQDLSRFIS